MSKKNRRKYQIDTKNNSINSTVLPTPIASSQVNSRESSVYASHQQEYKDISSDLIKVVVVNGLFLAGVLVLYFVNKNNPFLDSWYNWLF